MQWTLGANRYAYTTVSSSSGASFTISSATYEVFDTSDESLVDSGDASISGTTVYCLWQPSSVGVYTVRFIYVIGSESFVSTQVIEVKETM